MAALAVALLEARGDTIWIGTCSRRGSEGIYAARFDPSSGALTDVRPVAPATNPSFLALHPTRPVLYAVHEIGRHQGHPTGAFAAYRCDPPSGRLEPLGVQSSEGPVPCHLAADPLGRAVVVANYVDGSVVVFPLDADGRLGPPAQRFQHEGRGLHERRQTGPHAHGVTPDPLGRFVWVPDLGIDRVVAYRWIETPEGPRLERCPDGDGVAPAGSGPRHFLLHPGGRRAWSVNELTSSVTAFARDNGRLVPLATVGALPADFAGANTAAEIALHPNGRVLYTSNRGHDSIAWFRLRDDGVPELAGHAPTGGRTPRHFAVASAGRFLLAANQETDNIVVLELDPVTGEPGAPVGEARVPAPVCILFSPLAP